MNSSSVLSSCEGNTVASLSLEYMSKRSVFLNVQDVQVVVILILWYCRSHHCHCLVLVLVYVSLPHTRMHEQGLCDRVWCPYNMFVDEKYV